MNYRHVQKLFIDALLKISYKYAFGKRLKYRLKKSTFNFEYLNWSINIYKSISITNLKHWHKVNSINRYTETDVKFSNEGVADPFLVAYKDEIYLLYEAIKDGKGEIWSKKLVNNTWLKPKRIITEDFHLSYPFIWKEQNTYYIIPESCKNKEVRLYRCIDFPEKWEMVSILKKNVSFVDTNVLLFNDRYYWITYDTLLKKERIFYSTSLKASWIEHPCSKINNYRNAGPMFMEDNILYRPVQKSYGRYGEGVTLLKVDKLNQDIYSDSVANSNFLEKKSGFSLDGTHHISTLKKDDAYLIAVDGKNRNFYNIM